MALPTVSVIILSAGESKRFGKSKLLMPLGDSTIIEHTVNNYLYSKAREIILVLGNKHEDTTGTFTSKKIITIVNSDFQSGMSSSIVAGIKLVDPEAEGILFALADQPFVSTEIVNKLIDAFYIHKKIVMPVYKSQRGNPVIFSTRYRDELLQIKGDIGGREVVKRHQKDVLEVVVDCEGIIMDIDTVEQYQKAINKKNCA